MDEAKLEYKVAHIIDPAAMTKYERALAEGRTAANGKPWAEVAYGRDRELAILQARAAISLVRSAS